MSKYNHKQNISWTTYDGDDILEEVETLVAENNAPMTFIDALEVVRSTIKYKAEKYNDCVNSTYYSFNDTSNGKVMGIYSEFEHFKSLDIDSFNSELKTLFKKFDSFYEMSWNNIVQNELMICQQISKINLKNFMMIWVYLLPKRSKKNFN